MSCEVSCAHVPLLLHRLLTNCIDIEVEGETVDYAVAGSNVTIYLAAIDPIYVNIGCVLCEPKSPIPLASTITAQIVTFELKFPLTTGSAVGTSQNLHRI